MGYLGTPALVLREAAAFLAMSYLVLTVVRGAKRVRATLAAGVATGLLLLGERDAVWFVDRAWTMMAAGWFWFISMRKPAWTLTERAVAAVAVAALTVTVTAVARPEAWAAFDAAIAERAEATLALAMETLSGESGLTPEMAAALDAVAKGQAFLFPALASLATAAALAMSWWLYSRVSLLGKGAMTPLAKLAFNDHWVWVFVAGLALLAIGGIRPPDRIALNVLVFTGLLFALRGLAVLSFLSGRYRSAVYVGVAITGIVVWPALLGAALVLGLADVWLDTRGLTA